MRLLADENVHPVVIQRIRMARYEVEWIAETAPGLADSDILERTDIGELVLITYDRDFGEFVFNKDLPHPLAIIYSRMGRAEPRYIADCILQMLESGLTSNAMHVIKKDSVRSTPFPIKE